MLRNPLLHGRYLDSDQGKEELSERVKAVRHVLEKANVLINEGKSTDESPEVEWLGYELSTEGIKPTKGKTDMI